MAARGEYGRFYKRSHNETKREALKRDPYLNVKGTINVGCPVLIHRDIHFLKPDAVSAVSCLRL